MSCVLTQASALRNMEIFEGKIDCDRTVGSGYAVNY
jgi:hypothetical protein